MRLKALSHYDDDKDTRYGDCILLYDDVSLIVYDCGHTRHAQEIGTFLENKPEIVHVNIVVSHNDSDHTNGVISLLELLYKEKYEVTVYSPLYLKSAHRILAAIGDNRRTLSATRDHILEKFDNIEEIVNRANEYEFTVKDATVNTKVAKGVIVGPTEDEFLEVIAQAIEDDTITQVEGETVMNAASVQLKCELVDKQTILLCGDSSPSFMRALDNYGVIQLPHHGKLEDAKRIFEGLTDPYNKIFIVSDNTGSGTTSGGSDNLVDYMDEEKYTPALNTKDGVVEIPKLEKTKTLVGDYKGVKLGEMDCKC